MSALPVEVIEQDHALERGVEVKSAELAKLRWHWTLDESNPERVRIVDYAHAVEQNASAISRYANLHKELIKSSGRIESFNDAYERAQMSTETEAVVDAVAEARGNLNTHQVRRNTIEVSAVRAAARELAEEKGTSVAEEAPQVARRRARADAAASKSAENMRELRDHAVGYALLDGLLSKVIQDMRDFLVEADNTQLEDEYRDDIRKRLDHVREMVNTAEAKLLKGAAIDWDSELLKITEGA